MELWLKVWIFIRHDSWGVHVFDTSLEAFGSWNVIDHFLNLSWSHIFENTDDIMELLISLFFLFVPISDLRHLKLGSDTYICR